MNNPKNPLRLNVGFIAHQPVGYRREFHFSFPTLNLPPDLALENFEASARISRNQQGLLAEVKAQANTSADCVRCLTPSDQFLATEFTEQYAFSARSAGEEDSLLPETGLIDLGPLMREYLILEIPISPLCQPNCKGLCPVCGENRNDVDCQHDAEDIDPRLANLKSLLGE